MRAWLRALVYGVVLGIASSVVNSSHIAVLAVLSLILGTGSAWAAMAVWVARSAASRALAAGTSALTLLCSVVSYELTDTAQGNYRVIDEASPSMPVSTDWNGMLATVVAWCLIAAAIGPLLGLVGHAGRRQGPTSLIARLVVPSAAISEMVWRLRDDAPARSSVLVYDTRIGIAAIGVIAALVILARFQRSRRAKVNDVTAQQPLDQRT